MLDAKPFNRAQTSLAQFNGLYVNAIDTAERAAMPSKHIASIISTLTWDIYLYVTRGLYESHKLVFALMLANKVLLTAGKVREQSAITRSHPCAQRRRTHSGCKQGGGFRRQHLYY